MNEKAVFVKEYLEPLLQAAKLNVKGCSYVKGERGSETVIVEIYKECIYQIDVTADSLITIAADVINFMKYK